MPNVNATTGAAFCYYCDSPARPSNGLTEHPNQTAGLMVCEECFSERWTNCQDCAVLISTDDAFYSASDAGPYCPRCNPWRRCRGCHEEYRYDELNDNNHCADCAEARNTPSGVAHVQEYGYKPDAIFHRAEGDKPHPVFYGIELEVERDTNRQRIADIAARSFNEREAYVKTDGSLINGLEIVMHPMSWAYLQANAKRFTDCLATLSADGCRSYNHGRCGLHVHVSRAPLNKLALYRLQSLVYDAPWHWQRLSRRSPDNLNQWCRLYLSPRPTTRQKIACARYADTLGARYLALNLEPRRTVEFRLFRGTLNPAVFWAVLELVRGAVEYCRADTSIARTKPGHLRDWMRHQDRVNEYARALALWDSRTKHQQPPMEEI